MVNQIFDFVITDLAQDFHIVNFDRISYVRADYVIQMPMPSDSQMLKTWKKVFLDSPRSCNRPNVYHLIWFQTLILAIRESIDDIVYSNYWRGENVSNMEFTSKRLAILPFLGKN